MNLNWFWAQSVVSSQAEEQSSGKMSSLSSVNSPSLTPQFCFNERVLRDFLRLSRSTIDDSITQNLNALLTPAREGFNPSSTDVRQLGASSRRNPSKESCATFKNSVLFPSWQSRSDVLNYCAMVATSPDPEDPGVVSRQVETAREQERVVDERLDPYSGRYFPREARTESLANLVRNERSVEQIIRARTWGIVSERCDYSGSWEDALNQWHEHQK
ncbi:caffeine-induced death protein Cid2, putative [Talaromyces stipitatus ATCC 10500]|uniref:Caffeine-induced death protein Cid2, putative n=1 Tax=Talaromyces stipitatus (strain ATCC 10500 / CBS 375.48 / QM 6759 / NRRL 1006) TaxID=441959 RepID=B8LWD8_TALSN|nr:caffeine-induced death protein Cid2, putative [Talaromyces stipitatus ATCC 10500]EED24249.1 caffeine-induced death protein Cid2, putative [Talaromyces stipitatus ATCC 10500]